MGTHPMPLPYIRPSKYQQRPHTLLAKQLDDQRNHNLAKQLGTITVAITTEQLDSNRQAA